MLCAQSEAPQPIEARSEGRVYAISVTAAILTSKLSHLVLRLWH